MPPLGMVASKVNRNSPRLIFCHDPKRIFRSFPATVLSSPDAWVSVVMTILLTELSGQANTQEANGGFGESICMVDMAPFHITSACNILELKGIHAGAAGSRGFGIFVPKKDVKRATEILIADAILHPFRYVVIDGYKGQLGVPKKPAWKKIKLVVDVEKLSSSKVLRENSLLRGFVRRAAKEMKTIVGGKPILKEVWYVPLDYVDKHGKTQAAYQAEAKYAYRGNSDTFQAWGWTWDKGRGTFIQNSGGDIP